MTKSPRSGLRPASFFAKSLAAFEQATSRVGREDHDFLIAGQRVKISFAGPALVQGTTAALSHGGVQTGGEPDLVVRVWDSATTATSMPPPEWGREDYTGRGDIRGFNHGRFHTSYRIGSEDLSMVDGESGNALFWLRDAARLPLHEAGAPLRTIFNAWFGARRIPLIHAGAVGTRAGGVVVVGRGGIGKSTLTLAAAMDGLDYAGDDYVLVQAHPSPRVHGLYRTAKLDAEHLARVFPSLHARLRDSGRRVGHKRIFFVDEDAGGRLSAGFPIRALIVPELSGRRTTLRNADPGSVLRAALPSTINQLAGSGRGTFADLTALVRTVPGYVLELGPDAVQAAPRLLRDLSGEP